MELNKSIIKIRVALQNAKLNKSGKNTFAGFTYFELKDFLPKLNELMMEEGVNDIFTIEADDGINSYACLKLIKGEEMNFYKMPFNRFDTPLNKGGKPSMQDIQYLGALNTYYKRYLYLNAFGITDGDIIDGMNNNDLNNQTKAEKKDEENQIREMHIRDIESVVKNNEEQKQNILNYYQVKDIKDLTYAQAKQCLNQLMKGTK